MFGTADSVRRLCASDIVSMDGTFYPFTYMCVGATKGTYRRDIKMIVNHDYIKQCNIFAKKFWLIILANIVYFPFN